jgi:LL-diaminopimelate aminotransferase
MQELIPAASRINVVEEYYFSRKLKQIAAMAAQGKKVLNLGIGNPDTPPSQQTIDILIEASSSPLNHGYQSYIGTPELRNAFAGWYSRYFGVELDAASQILPLIGSKEGIMHISLAFVNPGEAVLIPNPGYPTYKSVAALVGADIIEYDLVEELGWQPDFEQLEKLELGKVKLMWVNYPNMPTGAPASKELFDKLVAFGKKHKILIVNDNPYSFIQNSQQLSILAARGAGDIAIELNSMSKSHNMAGWRIGMAAGNAAYIQNILKVKSNMDSGTFLPTQLAAAKALESPASWYSQLNSLYAQRRIVAEQVLQAMGCSINKEQVGMFVWGKVPDAVESTEALSDKILEKAGVFITPGFIFGSNGSRFMRISLCTPSQTLEEALRLINEALPLADDKQ